MSNLVNSISAPPPTPPQTPPPSTPSRRQRSKDSHSELNGDAATPTRTVKLFCTGEVTPVKTPVFERVQECPICLERVRVPDISTVTGENALPDHPFRTSCEHTFHLGCLRTWRTHHNKECPLCRSALPKGAGLTPVGHVSPPPSRIQQDDTRNAVATNAQRVRAAMQRRQLQQHNERNNVSVVVDSGDELTTSRN